MARPPKACVFTRSPEKDYNVLVGDRVELRLRIKNCGGDKGNFYTDLKKDGSAWASKYNEYLEIGALGTFLKKSFIMPNRDVKVDFYGGHVWSGDWSEDFHYTAYLRPRKEYCTQEIYVKTKDGASVRATVDWGDGTSDSGTTPKTFSHQYEVVIGKSYEIKVSASGYHREIIWLTLPCKSKITSILPKKTETCEQKVRVVTSDGTSVRARLEWGDGTHEDFNTSKTCSYDRYEKGKTYTVRATASGYDTASKTITACVSQFTLSLKKKVGVTDCYQDVRIETSDGKSVTYEITWGPGTWATGSTPDTSMLYCEKGKSHTATASAEGYKSASKTFTACTSQFTLTLTKGVAPACDTYTTKTSCEAAGCYWWADGTCHDTEEVAPPPPPKYELIASDNIVKTVKEPSGTLTIKELDIPTNKQSGDYLVVLLFSSPKLGYVMARLLDQDGKNIWTYTVSTNAGKTKAFSHTDLKKLILVRFESGNLELTSRIFELYRKEIKKDTVICDFDVYDAAGKKVTDLVAGVQYAVKAWLCKTEGGGCAEILRGCDSGCELSGEELKLYVVGKPTEVAKGTTNADGYTGFYWTPTADLLSNVDIKLEFKGSAKYNASEKTQKVTVSTLQIKCDCTNIAVGDYIFVNEVKKVLGKWVVNVVGGAALKKVTPDKVLRFTIHDGIGGFAVGKHYSVVAWKWWEYYIVFKPLLNFIVPDFAVIELKPGVNEVAIRYQVSIIGTTLCGLFDIDPESKECSLFLAEFADPVYVSNLVSGWTTGKDLAGNTYHPTALDTGVGALIFIPFVPAGAVRRVLGPILKTVKKVPGKATVMDKNLELVFRATCKGDEGQLNILAGHLGSGNFDLAVKQAKDIIANPKVAREVTSANFKAWLDNAVEHGGHGTERLLKAQADEIVYVAKKVVDEFIEKSNRLAGNWSELRKLWVTTCKTSDEVLDLERNIAKMHPDARAVHNLMRYSKPDYITALKAEKSAIPEFGTRFNEGLDFLLRHIGDEAGTEAVRYNAALKGLSRAEVDTIVRNLDTAGQANLGGIIKTLNIAPEGGMRFFDDAAATVKNISKPSARETKALARALDVGIDDAMKNLDAKWSAVGDVILKTDDPVRHPHLARLWNHIKTSPQAKSKMAIEGIPNWKQAPKWLKLSVFMGIFFVASTIWKTMQDFCFALFMGEETIQWGGFGGIVLNNMLYRFKEKPQLERKEIIKTFEDFSAKRHVIHDTVVKGSSLFTTLCLVFGNIFTRFYEADAVNLWALDTTIEYLKEGINPYSGIGECSVKVRANKDGVNFWYQGSPTKWYGGKSYSWVEIKRIPVRATPEKVTILAWKQGYVMAPKIITIYPEDVGKTGSNSKEMELFDLIPESEVTGTTNPFSVQTPPSVAHLPAPYGDADQQEYFGEAPAVVYGAIRCESIPTGAGVYLDVKDTAHYKGKTDINLDHIPVGTHKIIQTFPNFNDCVVNVNVVVEPMVYARCRFPTPTCSFTPSTTKPNLNEVVTFDASASTPGTGATLLSYDWDWGDGSTHGIKKIDTHVYRKKGVYAVKLTVTNEMGGSKVYTTNITVEADTGHIRCFCEPAEYCGRNADIFVDAEKVDVTKESGYTYIKDQTPGEHTIKCNLLDVMECSGSVTVIKDKDTDFKCKLKSKVPTVISTKVTKIVDGDSICTAYTDNLPAPLGMDHQEVRIIGYDAYECLEYPSECTVLGKYAFEKLENLIPVGTTIKLKIDQWLPLGVYSRVIADVFKGTKDIAAEMLKSCLVRFPDKKYRDKYYWDPWTDYERLWCDPVEAVASPEHKPNVIDIDTVKRTFKIQNRWLTLDFTVRFEDKYGVQKASEIKKQVEGGKTSAPIAYPVNTYVIKLFACVDKCEKRENWILVNTGYTIPTKKIVTFKSDPSGASVTAIKKETAHLVRSLKRVIQI